MAKKLKKVPRNPIVIIVELMIPWAAMALVSVALIETGFNSESAFGLAFACGLGMTGLIFLYERVRRKRVLARIAESNRR